MIGIEFGSTIRGMDIVTHAVMGAALAAAVASAAPSRSTADGAVGRRRLAPAIASIRGIEWRGAGVATALVSRHDFSPAMRRDFFAMLPGRDRSAPREFLKP